MKTMEKIKITFSDKSQKEYKQGVTPAEVAKEMGSKEQLGAFAAKFEGELIDLSHPLIKDGTLEFLDFESPEGKEIFRHSASHIMAQAVKELFPEAKLGIGPAIEDGFYYDFEMPRSFTPEDLKKIEERMAEIIKKNLPLVRKEISKEDAKRYFEEKGERFKLELLGELDERVTLYQQNDFVDLCLGPHVPSTSRIKAFKLLSIAGAYWRGDERNPMLQRIYGTAYETEEDLKKHLELIEEAKRRDHRKLGTELDLYSIKEEMGPGLVLWHPKGAIIRKVIEDFWREVHFARGYELVYSPHIAKVELWEVSGHLSYYREMMYSPMEMEGQSYLLKPMNCPFHVQIYKSKLRSYRDLPIRYAELGTVYRYERSGVLHGLLRVRGFTQDDAHIFCTPEQLREEILGVVDLSKEMAEIFGYTELEVELAIRDPGNKSKYLGDDEGWNRAEEILAWALSKKGLAYQKIEGEAKFYGPAIDIKLKDCLGRSWQGPTIQFDFNLPERFGVVYVGKDGKEHHPLMIHRTVLGAMERFIGGLVEHYAGAFPLWLAPVQVRVLTITDRELPYAQEIYLKLREIGFRAELDDRNEKVGLKIRQAEMEKIPYMLVIGPEEVGKKLLSVRKRKEGDLGKLGLEDFVERIKGEVASKK